ncbi:MAG: protein phosphatase CheZ [Pseudomonadota bacterium]
MIGNLNTELAAKLAALRDSDGGVSPDDIQNLIDAVMTTAPGDISHDDHALYAEIRSLADAIQRARSEIAALRPQEISEDFIPAATDELDAVVGATEIATNTIMDNAEAIQALTGEMSQEAGEKVEAAVTEIFTACGFQDITGQRITTVVTALKEIEGKVAALLSAFNADFDTSGAARGGKPAEFDESGLLNGPQLPAKAQNQDDIDRIFSGEG